MITIFLFVFPESRLLFFNLIECNAPNDTNILIIKEGIIRKFKKTDPYFPPCIGDWTLTYLIRHKINTN